MGDVTKVVVGLKRYGKSTHVVTMTRTCRRIVFYDSLGDDYNEGIVCRDWREFRDLWLKCYQLDHFRITFKPDDALRYFDDFCTMVYECGDMTVVIDEVQLFFRGQWCSQPFTKLITSGGHAEVELIGVTQAPKRLGELLRSQATDWTIFAVREDFHVKYVRDRCPGVSEILIKSLPKYEYLHFVDGEPHYWRCKDDLQTGRTWKEVVEYEGQAVTARAQSNLGEHADAGGSVGGQSPDSSESVSV